MQEKFLIDLPEWANELQYLYYQIRVHSRDKVRRRRTYRYVKKIKIRLLERGVCPVLLRWVCRYLYSLKKNNARHVIELLQSPVKQLTLF